MTLIVPEDWGQFVAMWLRAQSELNLDRVYAHRLPSSKTFPLMRVSRVAGGVRTATLGWVHDPVIQFDAWGRTEGDAYGAGEIAAALMDQRFHGTLTVATRTIVCSHSAVGGLHQGYDDSDPSLAHAQFTTVLTAHPAP